MLVSLNCNCTQLLYPVTQGTDHWRIEHGQNFENSQWGDQEESFTSRAPPPNPFENWTGGFLPTPRSFRH